MATNPNLLLFISPLFAHGHIGQHGSRYSLNDRLAQFRAQGFRPSVNSAELPPYQSLNSAAYHFRVHIAK